MKKCATIAQYCAVFAVLGYALSAFAVDNTPQENATPSEPTSEVPEVGNCQSPPCSLATDRCNTEKDRPTASETGPQCDGPQCTQCSGKNCNHEFDAKYELQATSSTTGDGAAVAGKIDPIAGVGRRMGSGHGKGRGHAMGHGRAGDSRHDRDHKDFFFLIDNKDSIRRDVKNLPNGIETVTESDDPEVASRIQIHVAAMYDRLENQNPIRMRDPLFRELFENARKIDMNVEDTSLGVKVTETSSDSYVVALLQKHAKVVSLFIKNGYAELPKNHAVPNQPAER